MRRASGESQPPRSGPIEFFVDDAPDAGPPNPAGRRAHVFLVFAAVAIALLLGFWDVLAHTGRSDRAAAPLPAVTATAPATPPPASVAPVRLRQCPGTDCPNSDVPEANVIAAFATDVPGAILSSEHTVTTAGRDGGQVLVQRVLRMAFGNVDMTVTIIRAGAREPAPPVHALVQRLTRGAYTFVVSTIGLYPPTHSQLVALAADPRVLTIQA